MINNNDGQDKPIQKEGNGDVDGKGKKLDESMKTTSTKHQSTTNAIYTIQTTLTHDCSIMNINKCLFWR